MLDLRLKSLEIFNRFPDPTWGPSIEGLDMDNIVTYVKPNTDQKHDWESVPDDIKNTFERLGIPEAERSYLAGVGAQYDPSSSTTTCRTPPPRWASSTPASRRPCTTRSGSRSSTRSL